MYYEVKNKISSTLVQLIVHFLMKQNQQQQNLDLKTEKNNSNNTSKFYCLSSSVL